MTMRFRDRHAPSRERRFRRAAARGRKEEGVRLPPSTGGREAWAVMAVRRKTRLHDEGRCSGSQVDGRNAVHLGVARDEADQRDASFEFALPWSAVFDRT